MPDLSRGSTDLAYTMEATEVLRVVDAAHTAGAEAWVGGGWGIDALVGHQRRHHADLDLLCPADPVAERLVAEALMSAGYRLLTERDTAYPPLPRRLIYSNSSGGLIDLIPVPAELPPFELVRFENDGVIRWTGPSIAEGTIAGTTVPCLSVTCQQALHRGYRLRSRQKGDLEALGASR